MTELRAAEGSTELGRSCLIDKSSEHSESASLLFLSGKLLSIIIDIEGDDGGGVEEGSEVGGVTKHPA